MDDQTEEGLIPDELADEVPVEAPAVEADEAERTID